MSYQKKYPQAMKGMIAALIPFIAMFGLGVILLMIPALMMLYDNQLIATSKKIAATLEWIPESNNSNTSRLCYFFTDPATGKEVYRRTSSRWRGPIPLKKKHVKGIIYQLPSGKVTTSWQETMPYPLKYLMIPGGVIAFAGALVGMAGYINWKKNVGLWGKK